MDSTKDAICKFWLFGHCKLKFSCPESHDVDTCKEGRRCKKQFCNRRHPKDCVYGNRCGFKSCNHLHPPLEIIDTTPMETVLLLQKEDDYPCV